MVILFTFTLFYFPLHSSPFYGCTTPFNVHLLHADVLLPMWVRWELLMPLMVRLGSSLVKTPRFSSSFLFFRFFFSLILKHNETLFTHHYPFNKLHDILWNLWFTLEYPFHSFMRFCGQHRWRHHLWLTVFICSPLLRKVQWIISILPVPSKWICHLTVRLNCRLR